MNSSRIDNSSYHEWLPMPSGISISSHHSFSRDLLKQFDQLNLDSVIKVHNFIFFHWIIQPNTQHRIKNPPLELGPFIAITVKLSRH